MQSIKIQLLLLVMLVTVVGRSQGILSGLITDEDSQPLPFATLYIDALAHGTASNEDGRYRIALPNGTHTLVFQYLGYNSITKTVTINNRNQTLDIQLMPEPIRLETIEVGADQEDPAYSVMRRAIAKAKFHTQQIDEYTATSYIKGSGRIKDLPGLFRKKLEKEMKKSGVDTATAFVQESVNEIYYKRPDQFEEKVISVRKIGEDNNTSPNNFVNSSFYNPEVNNAISPLSPKAFAYYRFEYLGFFSDRAYTINKIKVTPRSRGDQVFEGVIYIVEGLWSIHSLDLFTYIWGIKFNINQVYAPVLENVWLPVNQIYDATGSFFGFDFEYRYFANVSDYQITLNPDLTFVPEVIDDKIVKERAKEADGNLQAESSMDALAELSSGKEVSRKKLRKILREYEKMEMEDARQDTLEDVTFISNFKVDSLAYERDSLYWETIRPIPLSEYEVKGYKTMDSISIAEAEEAREEAQDTLSVTFGEDGSIQRKPASRFKAEDLILGGTYKRGDRWRWGWNSIFSNAHFNTVEGYHLAFNPFLYNINSGLRWRLDPFIQYSFGRNRWNWKVVNRFTLGKSRSPFSISFDLGRYTAQLDEEYGVSPPINTFWTLIFEKNFMKIHQKEYGKVVIDKRLNDRWSFNLSGEYAERTMLYNTSFQQIFDSKKRTYTTNQPYNVELGPTDFNPYNVFLLEAGFSTKPWLKYRVRNGKKRIIDNSSPLITFTYRTAIKGVNNSLPTFHHLDLGFKHVFNWGVRGQISLQINAGTFLDAENLGIAELKHFPANQTFLTNMDPVKSFRLLPFYQYSTQQSYLETHAHYQFRKFLITQMPLLRIAGVRENIFINSLETPSSNHYVELGYGINYILRVFRVELVTSYESWKFQDWGIRIGIASNLETLFD